MSFNLEQMDPSDKSKASNPMHVNMVPHLLSSTNKQSAQVDLLPRYYSPIPVSVAPYPYPYQADFSREQAVRMGILPNFQAPTSVYMGLPQLSSGSSLPIIGVQNPMSVSVGSQVSASKKQPAQRQAPVKLQNSIGINQFTSMNKRPSQPGPPPKVQTESFESVRSKLRESLAASLAMVSEQQNKPQVAEKNSPKEAVSQASKAEDGIEQVELPSTTSNPSACRNSPEAPASNEPNANCSESQDVPSDPDSKRNMGDQTEPKQDDVQKDQTTHASLLNEMPFSSNPVINDELLQGHGLCWASDVDAEISDTIISQDLKRPKLSHEEVIEGPKSLIEEVTGDSKEASTGNVESLATKIEANVNSKEASLQNAESLATKIEAELFKLFGGVNKKYKEKARSLLFNLKDRSNPELRERVLSGDIAPERLCSMTAEELASKELSQWRLAKAEEMAQMVVLQDSEVDIRRLVKKTHKGEFQVVEVEQDDNISMEVAVGESVLSHVPSKANGVKSQLKSKEREVRSMPRETKASEGLPLPEKGDSSEPNDSGNLDTLLNEKPDFMQDLIVDELKDTELLPPIVSLDEFMQALDSEPPFDNLSMGTNLSEKNLDNSEPEMDAESDSSEPKSDPALDTLKSKLDSSEDISGSKLSPPDTDSKGPEEIAMDNASKLDIISRPDNDVKSSSGHAETDTSSQPDVARSRNDEHIWEGLLQLNISVLATVIGFFRSGEKTSTQEWPSYLEIKGRVRVDAFEKFLQELPLSRSRAIMIAQFCWKAGSQESGRLNMIETANSYIADQRVGFAEPSPGVELYFCPPHPKTTEMLERHLPKDHTETLHSTVNGLIGVVVWRRPHVTTISPRLSSHHKHGTSAKKQSSSKRQQQDVTNSSFTYSRHSTHPKPLADELIDDDVPPGFGPGNARDEDDLPEFDFHSSSRQKGVAGRANSHTPCLPPPLARPVEQMRELIHRYGNGDSAKKSGTGTGLQSWTDDDDIPEWQPHCNNQQLQQQQQLPPPPPPPPQQLPQPHNSYQQQTMQQLQQQQQQQPFLVNQNLMPPPPQQQQPQQLMPLGVPLPMPMQPQFNPQMGFMQGQQQNMNANVNPGWQQGGLLWPPSARGLSPSDVVMSLPINGGVMMQPCHLNFSGQQGGNGQFYGVPATAFGAVPLQNGMMGWRPPDVPRNSGV